MTTQQSNPRQLKIAVRVPDKSAAKCDIHQGNKALATHLQAHDGKFMAAEFVKEARNPSHPAHSWFTWDDSTAARLYRETVEAPAFIYYVMKGGTPLASAPSRVTHHCRPHAGGSMTRTLARPTTVLGSATMAKNQLRGWLTRNRGFIPPRVVAAIDDLLDNTELWKVTEERSDDAA